MNKIMQAITGRRSIRRFTQEPVPDDALADILRAVQWSPSWANTQCWELVIVSDRHIKEQLQGILTPKNPASIAMVSAPVVLAVCGKVKKSGYYRGTAVTLIPLGYPDQNPGPPKRRAIEDFIHHNTY